MRRYRVVHWGSGATGRHALGAILDRDDFELVGQYVVTPSPYRRGAERAITASPNQAA